MQVLLKPFQTRFNYHFFTNDKTNRSDKVSCPLERPLMTFLFNVSCNVICAEYANKFILYYLPSHGAWGYSPVNCFVSDNGQAKSRSNTIIIYCTTFCCVKILIFRTCCSVFLVTGYFFVIVTVIRLFFCYWYSYWNSIVILTCIQVLSSCLFYSSDSYRDNSGTEHVLRQVTDR